MQSHAKIVIVGGGIMGTGLLYHLAEEGCTDVLLIEKAELTSGSTWHAAGQCPNFVGDYNLAKINAYGNQLYPTLEAKTGQYVSWHAPGSLRLARSQADLDWFRYVRGFGANAGFPMEIIGVDEIKQLNPFLVTDGVIAAAWTPEDGHADPSGLCNAMAKGATQMGAKIARYNRVIAINAQPGGNWEVVTEKGTVIAETVVNAAGCYARQVAQMVGADVPIINMEHHYLITDPIPAFVERDREIPVMRDSLTAGYFRQEQNSGLIGIYEHTGAVEAWAPKGVPEWASESELFTEDLDRLMPWLGNALERMPVLADAGIKQIFNGAISHTPDGPPLLGPVAGLKNFWLCCGASFGIAQGAGCGKYLAQWMLYGDADINMTGLDPRRFGVFADDPYLRSTVFQDYCNTFVTPLPSEELPAGRAQRTSPLYETLKAQGAVHSQTFGWERPKWFSLDGRDEDYSYHRNNVFEVVRDECLAVRDRVGIMDFTGFAKYEVRGPDARAYLNRLCANRIPSKQGGITLTHVLSDQGRIQGEMTITCIAADFYYVLSAASAETRDLDHLIQGLQAKEQVSIQNVTDDWGLLVVAGPRARDLLSACSTADFSTEAFRWFTGQAITIAGVPVRALRMNYVGELGWELHAPIAQLTTLYDALWQAGQPFGIANFGLYAVNSLRIEKGYRGWGAELTNEVTLLDADMERFIRFDKKPDFNGRAATLAQRDAGRSIQLVYLTLQAGTADVRGGEPIYSDGRCIGVTTSGGYGHRTDQSLGFGYVAIAHSAPGTVFEVEILGERYPATVLAEPVWDPSNVRQRA